jgi:acyl-CoA synthetase (AMP-forming)/AMP-acid ligase II
VITETTVDADRAQGYRRARFWPDETLDQHFAQGVSRRPEAIAVVDDVGRMTFGEVSDRVERLAGSLRDLGVGRGDVVSVQLPNWSEFVIAHLALERLEAVTNPMLTQYRSQDLGKMLDKLGSVAAIVPSTARGHDHLAMWLEMRESHDSLRNLIVARDPEAAAAADAQVHDFDELVKRGTPVPFEPGPRDCDAVNLVIFTSGTVASKGVMHSQNTTLYGIQCYAQELELDDASVVWMPSPISHGTGLQWGVRTAMYLGAKLVLQDRWSAEDAVNLIAQEGCTVTMSATPFVHDLRLVAKGRQEDLRSMEYFVCAGAPIPREVMHGVREELGMTILRAYGMSEHFVSTICRPDDPEDKRIISDGRPFLGTEVAVYDEERAQQLPAGIEGELAVRGPGVALGYLRDPERTRETWTDDGWQFTDDLAEIDADGYVRIVGRKKDLIIRGGLNIAPAEIEALLLEHPSVHEVAIIGVSDARLGERICAVVVTIGEPPELEELKDFLLAGGVSKIKLPEMLVVREQLPKTPSGKVKKDILRNSVNPDGSLATT